MAVHLIAETGSTNADLLAQAAHWREGDWLRAERQHAGRGRLARAWQSLSGNLHASTLIRLRPDDPPAPTLGLMLGVAVHDALTGLMPDAGIQLKWPNDLLASGAKLAGMLLERQGACVVAGIGVNVAVAPALPDRPTTALAHLPGGGAIDAAMVLDALIPAMQRWLDRWRSDGPGGIMPDWLARAHPVGTPLLVSGGAAPVQGVFGGLTGDGALILDGEDGTRTIIHSGDVGILP